MNELTKAEEQVMQHLWKLDQAFLKDIVEQFSEPRPAYTTISTVVGVLVRKGFISFDLFGKVRRYHPNISKERYFKKHFKNVIGSYFNGSSSKFARYFTENEDLNLEELEEIKNLIQHKIENLKEKND